MTSPAFPRIAIGRPTGMCISLAVRKIRLGSSLAYRIFHHHCVPVTSISRLLAGATEAETLLPTETLTMVRPNRINKVIAVAIYRIFHHHCVPVTSISRLLAGATEAETLLPTETLTMVRPNRINKVIAVA